LSAPHFDFADPVKTHRVEEPSVFKELVEHHIQDEEKKVFKSAEKALDHDEIQDIMKKFDQEKQKIKKTLK